MIKFRKNVIPWGEKGRRVRERFDDESVCNRCGKCCYQGFVILGLYLMMPDLPCKYLIPDKDGRMNCKMYRKRHEIDWCNYVTPKTVRGGLFPPDCAYVQGVGNYHGKIAPPKEKAERIRQIIYKRVKQMTCPEYINREDWIKFMNRIATPIVEQPLD